jgi:DNA-binding PadR family transcriptional regulator
MADPMDPASLLPLQPAVFQILVALAGEDAHGYAIMQDVAARTGTKLGPGTLYTTMPRLLEQGLVTELRQRPAADKDDPRRRYYSLTPFGRAVARAEAARLAGLVAHARERGLAL